MSEVVFYLASIVPNTAIIIMDLMIMHCAFTTFELRHNFVLHTIFLAMVMDIAAYITLIIHDLPSFITNVEVYPNILVQNSLVMTLFVQWFTQLFVLLVLSVIHAVAVFSPARFRNISFKNMHAINVIIVLIGIVLSAPLFTPYCGFCYFIEGHFWGFDSEKPYTYIYVNCNLVLQGVCAIVVACVDVLIIWKIRKVRVQAISETRTKMFTLALSSQSTSVKQASTSREMQLAFNFIFLSACFLIMTTFYNINIDAFIHGFITKLTYNLNLAKWSLYILGNKTIRMKFLSLLKCC